MKLLGTPEENAGALAGGVHWFARGRIQWDLMPTPPTPPTPPPEPPMPPMPPPPPVGRYELWAPPADVIETTAEEVPAVPKLPEGK